MSRLGSFGLMAALVLFGCASGPERRPLPDSGQPFAGAVEHALSAVRVSIRYPDGGESSGSATLIDVIRKGPDNYTGLFLTAKHVISSNRPFSAQFYLPGETAPYAVLAGENKTLHPMIDAATFEVPHMRKMFADPVPLAASDTVPGESILSAGYAYGGRLVMHSGIVSGPIFMGYFGRVVQSSAWTIGGMSGGPVLNLDGELVGLTVAYGRSPKVHYFVPLTELRDWLAL